MATARSWVPEYEVETNGTAVRKAAPRQLALPEETPRIRPVRKPRRKAKAPTAMLLIGTMISLSLVFAGGVLVTRWADIRAVSSEVVSMNEETLRLESDNQALSYEITRMQSIASLEQNAVKMGMQKPPKLERAIADTSVLSTGPDAVKAQPPSWLDKLIALIHRAG